MKITNITLLLLALSAACNQLAALNMPQTTGQPAFNNYLKGVAISCGQSVASYKFFRSETITCTGALINNAIEFPPQEAFASEAALDQWNDAQIKARQNQKQAWIAAIKKEVPKLLLLITAYSALTVIQDKIPQAALYQSDSRNEWIAINVVPLAISWLFTRGIIQFGPQQPSRLYSWLLLLISSCINYFALVKIHAYYQPYTMPTMNQHLFNLTGNFLAPNICCQLVS